MGRSRKRKAGSKKSTSNDAGAKAGGIGVKKRGAEGPEERSVKRLKASAHDEGHSAVPKTAGPGKVAAPEIPTNTAPTSKPRYDGRPAKTSQARKMSVPLDRRDTSTSKYAHHELEGSYEMKTISIVSSSSMKKAVTAILGHLTSTESAAQDKPRMARIHVWASAASKAISIVEIAKRAIKGDGGTWYQYTAIEAVLLPYLVKNREKKGDDKKTSRKDGEVSEAASAPEEQAFQGSDDGFERMASPAEKQTKLTEVKPKVRNVPRMWIFLSVKPSNILKKQHGQQSSLEK